MNLKITLWESNHLPARARRLVLVRRKPEVQGAVPRTRDENDDEEEKA
jgi:hypothetical protein